MAERLQRVSPADCQPAPAEAKPKIKIKTRKPQAAAPATKDEKGKLCGGTSSVGTITLRRLKS